MVEIKGTISETIEGTEYWFRVFQNPLSTERGIFVIRPLRGGDLEGVDTVYFPLGTPVAEAKQVCREIARRHALEIRSRGLRRDMRDAALAAGMDWMEATNYAHEVFPRFTRNN